MSLISISSVAAESVNANEMQIVARWKDTDKRPISAANRVRAVVLPANIWKATDSMVAIAGDKSLALFLHDAIEDLAKSYLSTIVEESNWMRVEVPQSDFQLSALLAWNEERAANSGRLNGDAIKAWAAQSVTVKTIREKHGDKIADALSDQFVKLAGPNHGLDADKAKKILTNLFQADDVNDNTGLRVFNKLTAISNKQADANLLDSIL